VRILLKKLLKKLRNFMPDNIFIVAGEDSGDNFGANLINEIKKQNSELQIFAIGGDKIEKTGGVLLENFKKISVVGLTEVIKHLPDVFHVLKKIEKFIKHNSPKFIILIDFPDFNFRVAKIAYKYNIPVYYFVSPQVWAWRQGRVHFLKKYVRKIFAIFPFEVALYKKFGVNVQFIGHPLAATIKNFKPSLNFSNNSQYIALLPGSRYSEIKRLLPIIINSAKLLKKDFADLKFILPVAPNLDYEHIKHIILKQADFIEVIRGNSYDAISGSRLVISASGTATLESALFGKPVIIIYKVNFVSYLLGRLFIKVKYIGMPNILLGKSYNPELIQYNATSENIFIEAKKFLINKAKYEKVANLNKNLINELYSASSYRETIDSIFNEIYNL